MAVKDVLVPSETSFFLARTAGIPLVDPVTEPPPFIKTGALPAEEALIQFENATHGFLLTINPSEPWMKAQIMSAIFIRKGTVSGN